MLAIRLTRNAEDLKRFFEKVDKVCDAQIWFEHKADAKVARTHVHGLVSGITVSVETVRNWLRFDALWAPSNSWDKSDWSFKTAYKSPFGRKPVDAHMITYMSKGTLSPVHRKLFDDWTAYRSAWVEPVVRQKKLTERETPVLDKQITQWEMLEQVRLMLAPVEKPTDEDIVEKIIHVHRIHQKLISRYKIRDFYDTYKAYHGHEKTSFYRDILYLCQKV